jgi:hypothetical protein
MNKNQKRPTPPTHRPHPADDQPPVPVHLTCRWSGSDGCTCSSHTKLVSPDRRAVRETVHSHLRDQNLRPDVLIYAYD